MVTAIDDNDVSGGYPVGLLSNSEEMAKRWLVSYFMSKDFRCTHIKRIDETDKLPKRYPILTEYKEKLETDTVAIEEILN